ncbi:hypothetical protein FOQG_02522 [Fusarium oxysporum f. sp. raphani 54005]|uniref:Uncharacterized protein n=1 Tax=Fusarium oxysporum f. sp. raphani 54005 TaxID=1089458 RepID=X0CS53_FUSOX|nr:hypothetical protein FOQG_02522 [Fusarium oxysporum f. sp. raphani 54005]
MPMPGIKIEEQGNGVGIHNIYMHPSLVWILIGASTFNRKHNPHKTKQKWLLKNQARTTTSKTRASRSSLTRLRTAPVNWRIRNPILLLRRSQNMFQPQPRSCPLVKAHPRRKTSHQDHQSGRITMTKSKTL